MRKGGAGILEQDRVGVKQVMGWYFWRWELGTTVLALSVGGGARHAGVY